jgi:hypothetical protein
MAREPVNVPLSEPIKAHGEIVTALTIRPPTAKDIRLCGDPLVGLTEATMRVDGPVMAALISNLAGIPPSSVDMLSYADFKDVSNTVMSFLAPPAASASTPSPSPGPSPDSSATPGSSSP